MEEQPFAELPEALVDDLLSKCTPVGEGLFTSFDRVRCAREQVRKKLLDLGLLHRDSEISSVPANPTSCGVDGAYAVERLLSTDLAVTASVAVEGLTPPTEKRFWPRPQHFCEIKALPHNEFTSNVLRAVMMCMELELASHAPHDVVMMDGSLTTPLIYINQGVANLNEVPHLLGEALESRVMGAVESSGVILESRRSDRIYVALPKYTTRREVSEMLEMDEYEDRGLLSFVLGAGEYVGPIHKTVASEPWSVQKFIGQSSFVRDYQSRISGLCVLYYRPFDHIPTLRLEVATSVAKNQQRLSVLLEAMRIQCGAPSIFEPYPLFMADRMVKHLGSAIPALRRTTTQFIAERWSDNLGSAFLAMHGYRTDLG